MAHRQGVAASVVAGVHQQATQLLRQVRSGQVGAEVIHTYKKQAEHSANHFLLDGLSVQRPHRHALVHAHRDVQAPVGRPQQIRHH